MKAKLIVEGKEFPVEINDPNLEKLLKPKKKTGYERVNPGDNYFYVVDAEVCVISDDASYDEESYKAANYYSDETVAKNNARADKLMRQLRRFAVEHRENSICWAKGAYNAKWRIVYDYTDNAIKQSKGWDVRNAFAIYFDTEEAVKLAIEAFRDELIWYFTEYKDGL